MIKQMTALRSPALASPKNGHIGSKVAGSRVAAIRARPTDRAAARLAAYEELQEMSKTMVQEKGLLNYAKGDRLYLAFREPGQAIRTGFLLYPVSQLYRGDKLARLDTTVFYHNQVTTAALRQQIEYLDAPNRNGGSSNAYS